MNHQWIISDNQVLFTQNDVAAYWSLEIVPIEIKPIAKYYSPENWITTSKTPWNYQFWKQHHYTWTWETATIPGFQPPFQLEIAKIHNCHKLLPSIMLKIKLGMLLQCVKCQVQRKKFNKPLAVITFQPPSVQHLQVVFKTMFCFGFRILLVFKP